MDFSWQDAITIGAPTEVVYRYLADFPRHVEWAQTLERLEVLQAGDGMGVGTRYRSYERQALQHDRRPHQPLTYLKGAVWRTICEIRRLEPHCLIAWHAYATPRMGLSADLSFELAPASDGSTALTQRIILHQPGLLRAIFPRLVFRVSPAEMEARSEAQWAAGLRNIKLILEDQAAHAPLRAVA